MSIEGYASATSVPQGGTINFHLSQTNSSTPQAVRFELENVAVPGSGVALVASVPRQSIPREAWKGYRWSPTLPFDVPDTAPSGFYRLTTNTRDGKKTILTFVVTPRAGAPRARTLLHISYLTPAAYNNSGGKSFYFPANEDGRTPRAQEVSLHRPSPYPRVAHDNSPDVFINEAKLLGWMRGEGIGVDCCSSIDLHSNPDLLRDYDCLVLAFHDEYWTKAMRDNCERFIRNGGNMIVLSGNTCYRQVRLDTRNRMVSFYKYASRDPLRDSNLDEVAIAWAEPPVNRPQNAMLGVGFTQGAFSLAGGDHRPMTIRFPDHWVFEGVTQRETSAFVHYETDAAAYNEEPEGYPRVTGEEATPLNTTVLATADLRDWQSKPGRATMTLHSQNGTVFNAATTNWINALAGDPVVTQITRNVFARLTGRQEWTWDRVGHARDVTGMTGLDGRLFAATEDNKLWRRYPVGADVRWRDIGHANEVRSMAAADGLLFCITAENRLWARRPVESETDWQLIGAGTEGGTRALAAAGGMLYAVSTDGRLHRRPASLARAPFTAMESFATNSRILAMTAYSDILFAATSDNRLLRSNRDFIGESNRWDDLLHCNGAAGLGVVEWMLYVATRNGWLWRLDLTGLSEP